MRARDSAETMNGVKDILSKHLEEIRRRIVERMQDKGRSASGRTASSLRIEVTEESGSLLGSSSFLALEKGRGAGAVPSNFYKIIEDWIKDKGIAVTPIQSKRKSAISAEERGLKSLAGAIAYTIMTKGTRLHRSQKTDDIYSEVIAEELEKMAGEISVGLSMEFDKINKEN